MTIHDKIEGFLAAPLYAVAGASNDTDKYGYRCFVALRQSGRIVHPLNPRAPEIAGQKAFASLPPGVFARKCVPTLSHMKALS